MNKSSFLKCSFTLLCSGLFLFSCQNKKAIDYSGPIAEWPSYGGTELGERYTALNQITPQNVKQLEKAWE
ncbi:MAG: hypothetical protein P8M34_01200, partial [Saprospiraceae bacterium]|nr:hypothetical protein [Saprospiraceae bacterium]